MLTGELQLAGLGLDDALPHGHHEEDQMLVMVQFKAMYLWASLSGSRRCKNPVNISEAPWKEPRQSSSTVGKEDAGTSPPLLLRDGIMMR